MISPTVSAVALLAALLPSTLAQTHSDCNPLEKKGCPNMPALGGNATFNLKEKWNEDVWKKVNQGTVKVNDFGTTFTVAKEGDSAQLQSKFYMLFGRLEVVLKAAPGQGIISSAILQSEALDEIDWEFKGLNNSRVSTAYFGKANMDNPTERGQDYDMAPTQDDFHNYTIDWSKDRIQWWVDDKMVRELKKADAKPSSKHFPQTPMNIRIGPWAAGDVKNNAPGVVEWAGGPTDFSKGPFTMIVREVYAKDYTTAKEYSWENMDSSGDWEKVKVIEGKSVAIKNIEEPHGVKNRFNAMSKTGKIAIIACVGGILLVAAILGLTYFIIQRRKGRREFLRYQAEQDKENADLLQYQPQGGATRQGYGRI